MKKMIILMLCLSLLTSCVEEKEVSPVIVEPSITIEEPPITVEELPIEEEPPITVEELPIEEEPAIAVEELPIVEEEPPIVEEEPPIAEEEQPIVEEPPIVEEEPPIVEEEPPIIEEEPPIVEEEPPIVEEEPPIVEEVIAPTITTNMALPAGNLTDWNLILLNHGAENKIDSDLSFDKVKFDTQYVDARAGEYYQKMYDAALKEGITLYLRSGYRSINTQTINYNANVQRIQNQGYSYEEAVRQTNLYYTVPGHSEHHTGLAFDIITPQYHNDVYTLNEQFAETSAYTWLIENCADYGFILRYAKDKTDITQINFEPWHYRYVGVEHAQYIKANDLCLEEYIALLGNNTQTNQQSLVESNVTTSSQETPVISDVSDDIWTAFNKIISTTRTRGTTGEITARDYLKSQLELANFDVEIQPFDFYEQDLLTQSNEFFNLDPYNSKPLGTAYNIIAQKDYDPSKKTIIFSAHYDTTIDSIGAFDNGSGTAVLLESAKLISNLTTNLDYNIRIIFFSCEEYFLSGSRYYVNTLTQEKNNILGCFNLDMVGNSTARTELYYGNQGEISPFIQELIRISPNFKNTILGSSDDYSFYKAGISSFTMTTSDHRHKDFNPDVLAIETDNKYITEEFLKEDANTVFDFMKNIDISNLL